jgi:hypothetical protein
MYIVYQMHVAWFETEMALETLKSVEAAMKHTTYPVQIKLCFNAQTYYDTPINGTTEEMFDILLKDSLVQRAEIIWKKDTDDFYGVGDWRRDCYDPENITIWGESDCLVSETYFKYIENIFNIPQLQYPFIVNIRQKKMWDSSWTPVEHEALQIFTIEQVRSINNKFVTGEGILTIDELNKFNDSFSDMQQIVLSDYYKGDGALICLSPGMPTPFIDPKIHMCGEDTYFYNYCNIKKVPLYSIAYYLKGHNTSHTLKRVNHTKTTEQQIASQKLDNLMRSIANESLTRIFNSK